MGNRRKRFNEQGSFWATAVAMAARSRHVQNWLMAEGSQLTAETTVLAP